MPEDGTPDKQSKPHYTGHRQRLRDRFLKGGPDALPDYEMLELILFAALPRGDTKPLAKRLIDKFGSYASVMSAEPTAIKEVDGAGDSVVAALRTIRDAAIRLSREELIGRSVLSSWQAVLDYCQAAMSRNTNEEFRLIFLNRKNEVMTDEVQQRGSVDHTPVYPREVVKRALDLGASAIIMVHNHPSGDPTPSQGDIDMTREVQDVAAKLGIRLHDHIVVGRKGTSSFRSLGLL